jgi:flagellar capping protein FliD
VLTGAHTGTEHGLEILSTTSLNRMDCSPDKFEHARLASNSMTRFDGYPNDGVTWLQRPTNEVGDVIEGTVVNLMGVGKATITIKNNVSEMATKIKSLVESVNLTKGFIKQNTKWGGGKLVSNLLSNGTVERKTEGGEENGIMIGNYGFQISLSELDRLMTRAIFSVDEFIEAKFPDAGERAKLSRAEKQDLYDQYLEDNGLLYTRLSDIGIRSDQSQEGVYVIEESRLTECLSRNPEAVLKLFTFTNGDNDFPIGNTVVAHLDEAARPRLSGFAVQLGFRMSDLTRANDVIDPQTGQVVKSAKGITKVLAENYKNIISGSDGKGGIDAKIAREERRIEQYKNRLEQKFTRLEMALAQLNRSSDNLTSQLDQLNNNSK